ncbi:MAG: SpoVR family protein [Candidatus Nanohaloarchaeota archaeon QJJ-5]|nr:SpoVR family protein [Candidatus Nanohaloarchaeota archaeon QJJ-5]
MKRPSDKKKQKIAGELDEFADDANTLAHKMGLNPRDTDYWIVNNEEMDEAVAYGGFQERYPHWRWAIQWLGQKNRPGRIYEIVVNDDPPGALLQEANSSADQKTVITHVEGHSDFFENNEWSNRDPSYRASDMLAQHRRKFIEYEKDDDIDQSVMQEFTDTMYSLEDNIHPVKTLAEVDATQEDIDVEAPDPMEALQDAGFSDDMLDQIESNLEGKLEEMHDEEETGFEPQQDLMKVIQDHGMRYDDEKGRAVEMEDEFKDIIQMMRKEAYYFAPQKLTKTMNEGWATYWQDKMMADEGMLDIDEIDTYGKAQAGVLAMRGMYNPYRVGLDLWQYVENKANRDEVIDKLFRTEIEVDGESVKISPDNYEDIVDFGKVRDELQPDPLVDQVSQHSLEELAQMDDDRIDQESVQQMQERGESVAEKPWKPLNYDGLAERHYSLVKDQNLGFIEDVSDEELENLAKYDVADTVDYESIEEALEDVDPTVGWDKMREVRESYNDISFISEYVTQEFVDRYKYAAKEEFGDDNEMVPAMDIVTSWDVEDVKDKLLIEMVNFGKPSVIAVDDNYNNQGELLLANDYNGIEMDVDQAKELNERVFEAYGKPINLVAVEKDTQDEDYLEHETALIADAMEMLEDPHHEVTTPYPRPPEDVVMVRYDGEDHETTYLDEKDVEDMDLEEFIETDYPYSSLPDDEVVQY